MTKSQFLREASRQRRYRHSLEVRSSTARSGCGNSTEWVREAGAVNARAGQFSSRLDELSESERKMLKAQISKQLERERRLHKARSYLYSVSRHIQLYTAMKNLETT
jgi:hypothetical protein